MARSVEEVAALPDPVGEVIARWRRPNGLEISQVRVPIGVIAIIYESRPNVTVDAGVLGLKAGNAVVLRGGKEALASNAFLAELIGRALESAGIARDAVTFVGNPDREMIQILKRHPEAIDLIIPRGGKALKDALAAQLCRCSRISTGSAAPTSIALPILRWPRKSASTPSAAARRCATRWKPCWCIARPRRVFCHRLPRECRTQASSCAAASELARL